MAKVTGVIDRLNDIRAFFHRPGVDHVRLPISPVFYRFLPKKVNGFFSFFSDGLFLHKIGVIFESMTGKIDGGWS
jgi:hypothetical protein